MKRLMTTILAAACGVACMAQEAPAPAKAPASAPAQRAERLQRMRMAPSHRMMRGMRGGIETRPFGKLADGSKTAIYHEESPTWLDWIEGMLFSEKGLYMARCFETGWSQIYFLS